MYKRQVESYSKLLPLGFPLALFGLRAGALAALALTPAPATLSSGSRSAGLVREVAVSYTHLDVYKRQP